MNPAYALFIAVLGLCVGSFLNVLISRLPDPTRTLFNPPRSACPNCGHEIGARDNVPVLSWVLLGGKCRGCRTPISVVYPAVEVAVMAIAVGSYWAYHHGMLPNAALAWMTALYVTCLLAIAITDLQTYIIHDFYTIGGSVVLAGLWIVAIGVTPARDHVLDAVVVGLLLYGFGKGMEALLHKEAMGVGDAFLVAFIATYSTFGGALLAIYFGAMSGVVLHVGMKWMGKGPVGTPAWLRETSDGPAADAAPVSTDALESEAAPDPAAMIPFGLHLAVGAIIVAVCTGPLSAWVTRLNHCLPWYW